MNEIFRKKTFVAATACALALFSGIAAFAQTDQDRLEAEKNSKSRELLADGSLELLPAGEFTDDAKEFIFGSWSDKRGHAVEKLYTIPKTKFKAGFSIQDAGVLMRSISKMKGMLYYSRSDKDWGVLYSAAYRIESEKKDEALSDETEGSADQKTIYAFMDDHTFGKGKYKITYRQSQDRLAMLMENVSPLCYGPIKAVQPGGFKMRATVIDNGDNYLVHICDYAEFKIISALKKRLNNSFDARLEAICLWFIKMGNGGLNEKL